jgi:hypothetical protein
MTAKSETISIIDFALTNSFGPVRLHARLSDFGNLLGAPARWHFNDVTEDEPLSCYMAFGDVEVGFAGQGLDITVVWAKFMMHRFRGKKLAIARPWIGPKIFIYNPFNEQHPTLESAKATLEEHRVSYTTDFLEPVLLPDTLGVLNIGDKQHVRLYFSNVINDGQPRLDNVSLGGRKLFELR